jgi:hypothetical protein
MQYVIPGAERCTVAPKKSGADLFTRDGDQYVIPGAEQISTGELLARRVGAPLVPRCRQIGVYGAPLFVDPSAE